MELTELELTVITRAKGFAVKLAKDMGSLEDSLDFLESLTVYDSHFFNFVDFFIRCYFNKNLEVKSFTPMEGMGINAN